MKPERLPRLRRSEHSDGDADTLPADLFPAKKDGQKIRPVF
jgi:hypothetical protein